MALPYNLGEVKSENGEVLRYEVEVTASDLAIKHSALIEDYPVYRKIMEKTGNPKAALYFQRTIKSEIYPVIINLCTLRWYSRNNILKSKGEEVLGRMN